MDYSVYNIETAETQNSITTEFKNFYLATVQCCTITMLLHSNVTQGSVNHAGDLKVHPF